jgi:hypothetical protein
LFQIFPPMDHSRAQEGIPCAAASSTAMMKHFTSMESSPLDDGIAAS